jgi:hypothetical protein
MTSISRQGFGRGFGYWRWKPAVISSALATSSADFVLYLDAGCELNQSLGGSARIMEYLEMAAEHGVLLMQQESHADAWCKAETLEQLGVPQSHASKVPMLVAGVLLVRVSNQPTIIDEWRESSRLLDGLLFDDRWDPTRQDSAFQDHRHDQAVLSVLAHREGWQTIPDETYFGGSWRGTARNYPIWAMRNPHSFTMRPGTLTGECVRLAQRFKHGLVRR